MDFNSVEQVLKQLEKQPGWEKFRDYRQLLKTWDKTINKNTAKYTRPLHISRQVLWVAVSSASRAQELSFQRYTLLKRLNKELPFVLKDIRFSSSGWHQTSYEKQDEAIIFTLSQEHRSYKSKNNLRNLPIGDREIENVEGKNLPQAKAKAAAERWLKTIEQSHQNSPLLLCSRCNSPTPSGELERWNLCYLCIAQKWSKKYRPPTFPESK